MNESSAYPPFASGSVIVVVGLAWPGPSPHSHSYGIIVLPEPMFYICKDQ